MNDNTPRETWVDAIKGFAILAVVLGHVANGYLSAGQYDAYRGWLVFLYNAIYAFHMPLFFILSGYVYSLVYGKNGTGKKLRWKTADMALVYFLWSILFGGMKALFSRFVSNQVSIADLLRIPLQAIDHFWYLYVLIFCYLLGAFLTKHRILPFIAAVSTVTCFLFCLIPMPGYTVFRLSGYFCFFLLGIGLQQRRVLLGNWEKPIWIGVHAGFGILIMLLVGSSSQVCLSWQDYGIFGPVLAYCLCAALIGLFPHLPSVPALEYLGRYSLIIYILHNFCIAICRAALPMIGIHSFPAAILLSFLFAVGIPVLALRITQKTGLYPVLFSPVSFFKKLTSDTIL